MKRVLTLSLSAAAVAAAAFLAGWAFAQEPGQEPADEAAMMMKMLELATPGEAHEQLMALAGDWEVAAQMRMSPDLPWQDVKFTVKSQKALGGRWLISKVRGDLGGMAFEGLQLEGYNNLTGQYDAYWTDSFSTWFVKTSGGLDESGARVMDGLMIDMVSPEGRPFRSVTTYRDADHYRTVMFDTIPPAGDVETMRMEFTRVK